jgi:hypothetical protein
VVVVDADLVEKVEGAPVVVVARLRLRLNPRASRSPSRVDVDAVVALAAKLTADVGK